MIDGRTPVIVAGEQRNLRELGGEPIAAMADVVGDLLEDDGPRRALARRLGALRVVRGIWPYEDPGRLIAEQLGLGAVSTGLTAIGGNEVYDLIGATAADIAAGRLDVAVVCAAEIGRTRRRLAAEERRPAWRAEREGAAPDVRYGTDRTLYSDQQRSIGARAVVFYALVESALRHRGGETPADHLERIASMWARASAVAADHPGAWLREPRSAAEIARPSSRNRLVAAPYPKLMTSNIDVDQSAAVLICSLEAARAAGVPDDRLVAVCGATGAADHWLVEQRWAIDESPAMRIAGRRALGLLGGLDAVDDLDLYSCFPAAVQVAQVELGIDPARDFTITGGLTFGGGPLNSYCLHALVTAVERIQNGRSRRALLTGNGGYFTKHSFLALGAEPSSDGFFCERPQADVDRLPRRPAAVGDAPAAALEAYTAIFDRDGDPELGVATVLDDDGARRWATTRDSDLLDALLSDDRVGMRADLEPGDGGVAELVGLHGPD